MTIRKVRGSKAEQEEKLKTENPISEKDEIKQAEERMAKQRKKTNSGVSAASKERESDK